MIECPECKAENSDDADFCDKCGNEIKVKNKSNKSSKFPKKYAIIGLGALILVIMALVVWSLFNPSLSEDQAFKIASNYYNGKTGVNGHSFMTHTVVVSKVEFMDISNKSTEKYATVTLKPEGTDLTIRAEKTVLFKYESDKWVLYPVVEVKTQVKDNRSDLEKFNSGDSITLGDSSNSTITVTEWVIDKNPNENIIFY